MALSKDKKAELVAEISALLDDSKMTVIAQYSSTSVKSMQNLRASAKENGTTVKVFKNRLVKKAMSASPKFENTSVEQLTGQVLYAFNPEDEAAAAHVLAEFAKNEPQLTFKGAIAQDGSFIGADEVKQIASLPAKDVLRAQLTGTIAAPLGNFVGVARANLQSLVFALNARAESL